MICETIQKVTTVGKVPFEETYCHMGTNDWYYTMFLLLVVWPVVTFALVKLSDFGILKKRIEI